MEHLLGQILPYLSSSPWARWGAVTEGHIELLSHEKLHSKLAAQTLPPILFSDLSVFLEIFIRFGNVSSIISSNSLLLHFPSLSFQNSNDTQVTSFDHIPLYLLHTLSCFLVFFPLDIFNTSVLFFTSTLLCSVQCDVMKPFTMFLFIRYFLSSVMLI